MAYSMESSGEAYRLEKQAQMKAYLPADELSKMTIHPKGKVLDAGCGTGLMSRTIQISYPDAEVHACDISNERLEFGRKLALEAGLDGIKFFHSDLQNISAEPDVYNNIVCRYVLQHVGNPREILKEFHRILAFSGVLNVVEIDGILFNTHCRNAFVMECLSKLKRSFTFDLFIGSKTPALMKECGFESIKWCVEVMEFKGDALKDECNLTEERLKFALPLITSILGEEQGTNFVRAYLQELLNTETTFFYNKFIISGSKM